jgi:uncharacterized protein YdiU (UPF0061 family)
LFASVLEAQASLVARWMLVGFVHGVLNTDNVAISGEAIDFGPCAFMDAFDPATVFSSIDHGGRYAYGNQPAVTGWNLARLAEALLPLLGDDEAAAIETINGVLQTFPERFGAHWSAGMRAKLALGDAGPETSALAESFLELLREHRVDHTSAFRALATLLRGDATPARLLFGAPEPVDAWAARWRAQLEREGTDPRAAADAMDRVNPVYVPRNHRVEEALAAATAGDLGPAERLVEVLARPFDERPGLEAYATPDPEGSAGYRTFCGT